MVQAAVSLARPARRAATKPRRLPAEPAVALSRRSDTTLAEQLTGRYAELVRQRLLAPGARLPSVRECARRHAVSPATVVSAYDQLLARGLVEARPHRGFFVRASHDEAMRPASETDRGAKAPPRQVPAAGKPADAWPGHPARRVARPGDARHGDAQGHLDPAGRPHGAAVRRPGRRGAAARGAGDQAR